MKLDLCWNSTCLKDKELESESMTPEARKLSLNPAIEGPELGEIPPPPTSFLAAPRSAAPRLRLNARNLNSLGDCDYLWTDVDIDIHGTTWPALFFTWTHREQR